MAKKAAQAPPKKPSPAPGKPKRAGKVVPPSKEPVAASSVKAGGGEVRLYDAWKAGLPELAQPPPEKVLAELQWWLVHFPSRTAVAVNGDRGEGMRLLRKLERGEDVNGLLTLFGVGTSSRARARVCAGDDQPPEGEPKERKEEKKTPVKREHGLKVKVTPGLGFDAAMKEVFTPELLIRETARLMRAQKPVFDREGNVVDHVDDFQAQINALKLAIEQAQGRAGEKPPPPKEPKKVGFEELKKQLRTSAAARMYLRREIDEAEKAAMEEKNKQDSPKEGEKEPSKEVQP